MITKRNNQLFEQGNNIWHYLKLLSLKTAIILNLSSTCNQKITKIFALFIVIKISISLWVSQSRLGMKGLNNSGTKTQPDNRKLAARFRVLPKSEGLPKLINLYVSPPTTAIAIERFDRSPILNT